MILTTTNSKIIEKRQLTESTFVLQFERNDINFQAGQHILVGKTSEDEVREYSVYSGENDPYLEILVKEVDDGVVSKQLQNLEAGNGLFVEGAVGFFRISHEDLEKKFLFIATGTGISPFRSFIRSYPRLKYTLLHGIRHSFEIYEAEQYQNYIACTTADKNGHYHGRVTSWLKEHDIDKDTLVYLCGNSNMIIEARPVLQSKGFTHEQIFTEVYF